MEDKSLYTFSLDAGTKLSLHDNTVIEFNSPMVIKLMWHSDVDRRVGTVIQLVTIRQGIVSDGLVLVFTLDKGACHENRIAIPEGSTVC